MATSFDGDFVSAILDEIALEGLDGITLSALWLRLSERPNFPLQIDDDSKVFIWNCIALHPEVEFYELPEARQPLVIFNRYQYIDPELDIVIEPDNIPEDIYPIKVIDDNGIKGSCTTYATRHNITSCIREGLETVHVTLHQAENMWGQLLVLVASQNARWRALVGPEANPQIELSAIQFCMLERIGRARYMGEVTLGKTGLSCLHENPKTLHYLRKLLVQEKLITKQMHFQKNATGQTGSGSLLHIKRFHVVRQSKMETMLQKICELLAERPNQREIFSKLRTDVGMKETSFKKLFQKPIQNCVRSRVIPYREFFPDADDKEALTACGKERTIRVVELIHPFGEGDDDEEDEDKYPGGFGGCVMDPYIRDQPLLCTAYNVVEAEGPEGITAQMLGKKLGLPKLETRQLCRNLDRRGIVVSYMQDIGRQRVTKYVSKFFVNDSKDHNKFLEEKRRILEFSATLQAEQGSLPIDDINDNIDEVSNSHLHTAPMEPEIPESAKVQKTSRNSITAELTPAPGKGKKKEASHITYRVLKRANMIIEAVKSSRLIDDIYKLQKMIIKEEAKEGYTGKVDKKSMQRLIRKLDQDGFVKCIKTVLRLGDQEKKLLFICDPSVSADDPLVTSTIEQAKLKSFGLPKEKPKNVLSEESQESSITQSVQELDNLSKRASNRDSPKLSFEIPKFGECEAKFAKMRHLYQFLFYLIYDYQGNEKNQSPLEGHPRAYNTHSQDWKMFIPPLPAHVGYPQGWALISDIILCMPLSIFLKVVFLFYKVDGLNAYINDPIKKHYLIKHLPRRIRAVLLYKRYYIYSLYSVMTNLSYCGMLSFGPEDYKEKDQVFIYLHHNLSIKDTRVSERRSRQITPGIIYPRKKFKLETLKNAEDFWQELESTCLETPLSYPERDPKVLFKSNAQSEALKEASKNKKVEEVSDNNHIPGDGLGAAGLDSSLFAHDPNNWVRRRALVLTSSYLSDRTKFFSKIKDENGSPVKRLKRPDKTLEEQVSFRKTLIPKTRGTKRKNENDQQSKRLKCEIDLEKPKVDDDKGFAKRRVGGIRVLWTSKEDTLLLLCKVVSLFLDPHSKFMTLHPKIALEVLNKHMLEIDKDKNSFKCKRRLLYLLKNPNTFINVATILNEFLEEPRLSIYHNRENLYKENQAAFVSDFHSLFEEIYEMLKQRANTPSSFLSLPNSIKELEKTHNLVLVNKRNKESHFFNEPQSKRDILKFMYHILLFSAVHPSGDKQNWNFTYYFIYQKFRENDPSVCTEVEKTFSKNRILKRLRQPSTKMCPFWPYAFTQLFERKLEAHQDFIPKCYGFLTELEENKKKEQRITAHLDMSNFEIWTLSILLAQGLLDFSIVYPNIVTKTEGLVLDSLLTSTRESSVAKEIQKDEALWSRALGQKSLSPKASTITFVLKESLVPSFKKNLDLSFKSFIVKQRKIIPLDKVEFSSSLSPKAFSTDENALALHNFIREKKELGATMEDIYNKFSDDYSRALDNLRNLVDEQIVLRVGTLSFRYVDRSFSSSWLTESFITPKEQRAMTTRMFSDIFHSPIAKDIAEQLVIAKKWKRVKFLMRVWKKPDGSLNKCALKKILNTVLYHGINSGAISEKDLCNKYAVSYQKIQILEVLEMLVELGCLNKFAIPASLVTPFSPNNVNHLMKEPISPKDEVFYEATLDCTLKLGYFIDYIANPMI